MNYLELLPWLNGLNSQQVKSSAWSSRFAVIHLTPAATFFCIVQLWIHSYLLIFTDTPSDPIRHFHASKDECSHQCTLTKIFHSKASLWQQIHAHTYALSSQNWAYPSRSHYDMQKVPNTIMNQGLSPLDCSVLP